MIETITADSKQRTLLLQNMLLESFALYDFFRAMSTERHRLTKIAIDYIPLLRRTILDQDTVYDYLEMREAKWSRGYTIPREINPFDLDAFDVEQYKNQPSYMSIVSENLMILDTFQSILEMFGHERDLEKGEAIKYPLRAIAYAMHYLGKDPRHLEYFNATYSTDKITSLETNFSKYQKPTSRKYANSRIKHIWPLVLDILKKENASNTQLATYELEYKAYLDNL